MKTHPSICDTPLDLAYLRERLLVLLLALTVLALGTAFAQTPDELLRGFDLRALGESPLALGGVMLLLIAAQKRAADRRAAGPNRPGWTVHTSRPWFWFALAVVESYVATLALYLLGYGGTVGGMTVVWGVLTFGAISSLVAVGLRDYGVTLFDRVRPRGTVEPPLSLDPPSSRGGITLTDDGPATARTGDTIRTDDRTGGGKL
ncbi:hypothetical protein [Deinococcus pimensis]|uniref:hypothetical protein n=1 Tax=Deinococcus pimensis TaxID=309888 RepID=UPI0004832D83|nr:hypothetical protein [Deinococcus pimensis]